VKSHFGADERRDGARLRAKQDKRKNINGHFGIYGGRYVPELLMPALLDLEKAYKQAKSDPKFKKEFTNLLKNFSGRPTPLVYAKNLTETLGGAKVYLKNEGLNHTGAHKITHCIGQALVAKRMGKIRLIAETGAGQHGVATATVAAKLGFSCTIYMGEVDIARQRPNVFLMEQLGAEVVPVSFGQKTLKDAVNAALKDYIENVATTHYLLGSALGPHPYPTMNRDFQKIIGQEIRSQLFKQEGKLPDYIIACVGGGSNAMGAFYEFIKQPKVRLLGVEAGGRGKGVGENAVRFDGSGKVGVIEGYKSYFLQDSDGNIQQTHSISAGLDYPGVGPELAYLRDTGRVQFVSAIDSEVLAAVQILAKTEGIIPALESAHAIAYMLKLAPTLSKEKIIVVNLSGRGDKDLFILAKAFKDTKFYDFMKGYVEEGI
jgi:tryptophan synthase beta chain